MSELLAPIDGAIADAGGDFNVCVESTVLLFVFVLLLVESDVVFTVVVSATATDAHITKPAITASHLSINPPL